MTLLTLAQQLHELGVVLTPSPDGTLRYKAPKSTLTPALLDAMRQHKQELHHLVEAFEERAAIAQCCSGFPRPEAEALAWACILWRNRYMGTVRHVGIRLSQERQDDE
jgi:hypothetical protein